MVNKLFGQIIYDNIDDEGNLKLKNATVLDKPSDAPQSTIYDLAGHRIKLWVSPDRDIIRVYYATAMKPNEFKVLKKADEIDTTEEK